LNTFGRLARKLSLPTEPVMTTSRSPSSSSASGAMNMPPPNALLLATATEYPRTTTGSPLSGVTVNVAGFQAARARSAAYA
jgi:hypothetical protein